MRFGNGRHTMSPHVVTATRVAAANLFSPAVRSRT
jgi:hypothetical protein